MDWGNESTNTVHIIFASLTTIWFVTRNCYLTENCSAVLSPKLVGSMGRNLQNFLRIYFLLFQINHIMRPYHIAIFSRLLPRNWGYVRIKKSYLICMCLYVALENNYEHTNINLCIPHRKPLNPEKLKKYIWNENRNHS